MLSFQNVSLLNLSVMLNLTFSLLAFLFLVQAAKVLMVLSNALLLCSGFCSALFLAMSAAVLVGTTAAQIAAAPAFIRCGLEHVFVSHVCVRRVCVSRV